MAQVTDRNIGANPTGFDMRTEINNIIAALESDNSGSSEPLNTVAYMKWLDTSNATYYYVKERNHDNTAWVTLFRYTVATKIMEAVSNGAILDDSLLVHKTGNETIAGIKTFGDNVGVGCTPSYNLHVRNNSGNAVIYGQYGTGVAGGIIIGASGVYLGMNAVTPLFIDSSSNILQIAGGGLGYGTGSGGTVTQITSKSTAVTLNKHCGQITMNNASLASNTGASFRLNNSILTPYDTIIVTIKGGIVGLQTYRLAAEEQGNGYAYLSLYNISIGGLAEAVVINFAVIKGAIS